MSKERKKNPVLSTIHTITNKVWFVCDILTPGVPSLIEISSILKINGIDLALEPFHIKIYLSSTFKDIKHTVYVALGFLAPNQTE